MSYAPADASFAAHLGGPRIGATIYNVVHSYVGPLILAAALLGAGAAPTLAFVWIAHIGFDRDGLRAEVSFGVY